MKYLDTIMKYHGNIMIFMKYHECITSRAHYYQVMESASGRYCCLDL